MLLTSVTEEAMNQLFLVKYTFIYISVFIESIYNELILEDVIMLFYS